MIVRIKKTSLRAANMLYYGGLAVMGLSLPVMMFIVSRVDYLVTEEWLSKLFFSLFTPGTILVVISGKWKERLYRCPQCRKSLFGAVQASKSTSLVCGNCGTNINFLIDE